MDRRSFLAVLFSAPLAKAVPMPEVRQRITLERAAPEMLPAPIAKAFSFDWSRLLGRTLTINLEVTTTPNMRYVRLVPAEIPYQPISIDLTTQPEWIDVTTHSDPMPRSIVASNRPIEVAMKFNEYTTGLYVTLYGDVVENRAGEVGVIQSIDPVSPASVRYEFKFFVRRYVLDATPW